MKVFTKSLASVLAVCSIFALSGCAKKAPDSRVATTANWNPIISTTVESNYYEEWQSKKEVATYAVTFEKGTNNRYSVSYANAEYRTEFYMESAYDWKSDTIESYRSTAEGEDTEPVYVYKTYKTMDVTFNMNGTQESKTFHDVLETVCKYRVAGKNLQPVYSYQKAKNTAPAELNPGSLDAAYVELNSEFTVYYNHDCTRATITEKAEGKEATTKEIGISTKEGHSVYDNSQIRAAIRAFTLTGGSSKTFNVVIPQNGATVMATATCSSPVEFNKENEEQSKILTALQNSGNYIYFKAPEPAEDEKQKTLRFTAVSISDNSPLSGPASSCWYTTVENADMNATRCVLVRMQDILPFGTGTLKYTLSSLALENQ